MTWKIGHRGACGHAPENTLASMQKALELGVDGFEFDIQMSGDGEPVVIHDDTLERTTSGRGFVSDYTFKELQQFDAGKGERIPSLRQVLDLVDGRCRLFIELKAESSSGPVAAILREYVARRGWSWEQLYVVAFDHSQLVAMRRLLPELRTGALLAGIPVSLAAIAAEAGAWSINPCIHHISKALVDDAHWRGLKVVTWTANEPRHIEKARMLGVDAITSDFPDRL
ncbi:MAG: glycerophosphodiester phosphodiesterase [Pseudomonadota bacterium]|nr:glycerophosphodiester phosphodiesterase [Pseudomonadota bacterium]